MEIDITHLADTDMFAFSHSAFEGGENAGSLTWRNALDGPQVNLAPSPDYWEAVRDWARDFGAWEADEISAMTEHELNALLLQFLAGDVRAAGADDLEGVDWEVYEADENNRGSLYRADNGAFYYSISR